MKQGSNIAKIINKLDRNQNHENLNNRPLERKLPRCMGDWKNGML